MRMPNMKLKCITAICKTGGIGYKNKLPWGRIKLDMDYFKSTTSPKVSTDKVALLMGANTFVSLPGPLKHRDLFVLTHNVDKFKTRIDDCKISTSFKAFRNLQQVTDFANNNNYTELWCVGGEQLYTKTLRELIFDEIHITYIDKHYKCDTFLRSLPGYYTEFRRKNAYDEDHNTPVSFHVFRPDYNALEKQHYIS
jgi:dihydrofolate reductase